MKEKLVQEEKRLRKAFNLYHSTNVTKKQIIEHLEFASEDLPFYESLTVPDESDATMTRVGKRGKKVDPFYLLDRWIRRERDAGIFQGRQPKESSSVWSMIPAERDYCMQRWRGAILADILKSVYDSGCAFNADQAELNRIYDERDANVIKTKRIIGCTTNGAASHFSAIQAAAPGVGELIPFDTHYKNWY